MGVGMFLGPNYLEKCPFTKILFKKESTKQENFVHFAV